MQSRDFVYWLQGFLEVASADGEIPTLTPNQIKMIQKHLNLVFKHEIDPGFNDLEELQKIHNAGPPKPKPPSSPWPAVDSPSLRDLKITC